MAAFCGEWWKLSRSYNFDMDSMIMDAVCRNTMVCTCFRPTNEVVLEHVGMYIYRQCVNGIPMRAGNHVYNLNIPINSVSCILLYICTEHMLPACIAGIHEAKQ